MNKALLGLVLAVGLASGGAARAIPPSPPNYKTTGIVTFTLDKAGNVTDVIQAPRHFTEDIFLWGHVYWGDPANAGKYVLSVEAKVWESHPVVYGVRMAEVTSPSADTWFYVGRLAGGQTAKFLLKTKAEKPADEVTVATYPVIIDNLYQYDTQLGLGWTNLTRHSYVAGNAAGGGSQVAEADNGMAFVPMLGVAIHPHRRAFGRWPDNPVDRWSLGVGTSTQDFLETIYLGVGYEIIPGTNLFVGAINGKTSQLIPGWKPGDPVSAGQTFTTDERKWDLVWGLNMETDIFNTIFKKP
jgi:hypothetical protein